MTDYIRQLALTLWDYHRLNHTLTKADVILVLCSHDLRVAERGAELFLEGWAPLLMFSGGLGVITRHMWSKPEAELFAQIARDMGVPDQQILIEDRSSNTGENVLFSRQLLEQRRLDAERFIVVQKPYMERRSFATFRKVWPQKDVLVTSPQDSFDDYLGRYTNSALTPDDVINIMVGDLQRIQLYPKLGFQIPQPIPQEVWAAYEALVQAGYDRHLATG
ncbi:YdcF family protein [Spirosoma sp. KUDC1026]|uniref:YdcF family protein n=1 Tax=Spirosoma sp. KUDC1026 TaxID=2745947 RepID=UPI00159B9ACB|nr:YdcF family protein [Spirosoma sp. KUDC1026]QKZ14973.1 YdcF family protein [Spirosoma sp. KUDC1026]